MFLAQNLNMLQHEIARCQS